MRPRIREPGAGAAARSLKDTDVILAITLVLMSFVVMAAQFVTTDEGSALLLNLPELGEGLACAMWSWSLWYATPIQLLALFFGKIDTERPSDYILKRLPDVPAISVPITALVCVGVGTTLARGVDAACGDTAWGIASGFGALAGAGMYEVGRPRRLSPQEQEELDRKWADFYAFAEERIVRGGRCHESEVEKAFRSTKGRYRDPGALKPGEVRKFIRNYAPYAERTSSGYYRNLSLAPRV